MGFLSECLQAGKDLFFAQGWAYAAKAMDGRERRLPSDNVRGGTNVARGQEARTNLPGPFCMEQNGMCEAHPKGEY